MAESGDGDTAGATGVVRVDGTVADETETEAGVARDWWPPLATDRSLTPVGMRSTRDSCNNWRDLLGRQNRGHKEERKETLV